MGKINKNAMHLKTYKKFLQESLAYSIYPVDRKIAVGTRSGLFVSYVEERLCKVP